MDEHEDVEPAEKHRVDMEEVAGHQPFVCAARSSAQVGPDLRGDGLTLWRLRIAQTLEGAMTMPMVASSPWTRR
ncbi:MAG: hypothetical protein M0Z40_14320 [Actinomycetota bacterium]|jgi:hypothetical protein|nr:hypothetical protein [Actinomycetota bacterium]